MRQWTALYDGGPGEADEKLAMLLAKRASSCCCLVVEGAAGGWWVRKEKVREVELAWEERRRAEWSAGARSPLGGSSKMSAIDALDSKLRCHCVCTSVCTHGWGLHGWAGTRLCSSAWNGNGSGRDALLHKSIQHAASCPRLPPSPPYGSAVPGGPAPVPRQRSVQLGKIAGPTRIGQCGIRHARLQQHTASCSCSVC